MRDKNFDFCGWATVNNIRCSDGRTILKDAFKHNDGMTVPLVWNHNHDDPFTVLGHAELENRDKGVYRYCYLNDTDMGNTAKQLIQHGDVRALSIYANHLKQDGSRNVMHGDIKEVSLVLAGANPSAMIESIMAHSDDGDIEEACIYTGEPLELYHADEEPKNNVKTEDAKVMANEKTIQDVWDTLTDEQKNVVYAIIGAAMEGQGGEAEHSDFYYDEDTVMKHNAFDGEMGYEEATLSHADIEAIFKDAKSYGSLRESFLAHAEPYGIDNIDFLFPDEQMIPGSPEFIKRDDTWVGEVMRTVHHSAFSRVKSIFADITEDEARAKGYIKGSLKKEEVFSLLKRSTTPTTVYKKQKIDRDDYIDIADFDAVALLKGEMRGMLNEELARAYLFGDGRLASDDDHIDPTHIRPVINDADLFTIRWSVGGADMTAKAKNFIRAAIKARKNYKGSGNPVLFTTEDWLSEMLLLEDTIGHVLFKTEAELATRLRVSKIVTVPVMEGLKDKDQKNVMGLIVNLSDYNVGADKGGAVNMFDDFDIDYNQMKYLIETRCSGALVKPFSAIVLREGTETKSDEPTMKDAMDEFRPEKE